MKYLYRNGLYPPDNQLLTSINDAAGRVQNKLVGLDLKRLGISEYNQRYIGEKLARLVVNLQAYSYLLALALHGSIRPLRDLSIVDYGAGSGIISILAKELGVGIVIYNDIYEVSFRDYSILSRALGYSDGFQVVGDIAELIEYINQHHFQVDAIVSSDVLEHIYNIETYLRDLPKFGAHSYRIVFMSAANGANPRTRRSLMKLQEKMEHEDRPKRWGDKERDTFRSFLSIRREMISQYDSSLGPLETERLARITRGLRGNDILHCVDEYRNTGNISYTPKHPTNTCDPFTGNGAENLLDTEWIKQVLEQEGFFATIKPGFWPYFPGRLKRSASAMLNFAIKHLGERGLFLSPYYVICGDRKGKDGNHCEGRQNCRTVPLV